MSGKFNRNAAKIRLKNAGRVGPVPQVRRQRFPAKNSVDPFIDPEG